MLQEARKIQSKVVAYRRDIHRNPELGFQEFKTAALVADALAEIGTQDIRTQVGRTGVIATIGPADGPVIGIRADMDALPIEEQVEHAFKSDNPGVMHACGHDAHTAMLLGAAEILQQNYATQPDAWKGRIKLLFQPAEEGFDETGTSGATAMIEDQAVAELDHVIALHVNSTRPSGEVAVCRGDALAAVDSFEAWVRGDGGHGAMPHQGVDPLYLLSAILPQLYGIPSRRISPKDKCVVSLGQIAGGAASNVIPAEVYLQGTIRSLSDEVRQRLWHEVEQCFKVAEILGGAYEFRLHKGYPAMVNDADVTDWLEAAASDLAGPEAISSPEAPFSMGAEDFAYMTRAVPGSMFMLGAAVENGGAHHTPLFDIDEDVFPLGVAVLAETARRYVTGAANGLATGHQ